MRMEQRIHELEEKVLRLEKEMAELKGRVSDRHKEVHIITSSVADESGNEVITDFLTNTLVPTVNWLIREVNHLRHQEADSQFYEPAYQGPLS